MHEPLRVFIYPALDEGTWVVEAIDRTGRGSVEMTIFSSRRSEERARRYCRQEYGVGCTELDRRRPPARGGPPP